MAGILAPIPIPQYFSNAGKPLAGGQLTSTLAGTSTPTPLYPFVPLQTPLQDPVILDAGGRPASATGQPQELWVDSALAYKLVLAGADGSVIQTVDNLIANTPILVGSTGATGGPTSIAIAGAPIIGVQFTGATALTISGFSGGVPGQLLLLRTLGAGQVFLQYQAAAVPASDRINTFVTTTPTPMWGGAAILIHGPVGQGWHMVAHEQGQWLQFTPILQWGGANVGSTYSQQAGFYVIHGNYVTGVSRTALSARGSSVGVATIANFPIVHGAGQGTGGGLASYTTGLVGLTGRVHGYFAASTAMNLTMNGPTLLADTNFSNTSDLIVMFRYAIN